MCEYVDIFPIGLKSAPTDASGHLAEIVLHTHCDSAAQPLRHLSFVSMLAQKYLLVYGTLT